MLDKTFDPAAVERKRYERWEASGAFKPTGEGAPFSVMMPPPNVTGSLHIGHALNMTLQDVLTRWRRMQGRKTLWQPGTDHAGIATQMVVERQLAAQNMTRHNFGRDEFIDKVWEWKAESGGTITRQLRRLGASPDWSRERFTMDEGLSRAVVKVFVQLHRDGLLYRDKRLVNWDPKLHTAISDLEVEQRPTKGNLWHLRYPIEGESDRYIVVATTRPETMLGDVAVAVHPDDERYKDIIGKHVILPLVGRRIPIVGDEYADPETGSGAVKITPAHDFNDFEVGKRHSLPLINVMDRNAAIIDDESVPERFRGLDRYDARKKVVAEFEELGLLDKVEPHDQTLPTGDRSGVAVEPWLTDQWYVDAPKLAIEATRAVEDGRTKFVPSNWTKTYYEWMRNIQPWCVSRQIWWGHRIPAWYDVDGNVFVEETEDEALAAARALHGRDVELKRDDDVLDTWFSSGLWPFSTLGWPDKTKELETFYPTDVLITGFDIIFFWVARMMMMGLYVMKEVPFRTVYIHALVRDERGQKMSKSKGNVIDPLSLVDKFGTDALRYTLVSMAGQGRDVKLGESRVEGGRNFATKLWNATRFCLMNECRPVAGFDPSKVQGTTAKWIVGETALAAARASQALEEFRFDQAALALYQFAWGTFCDWWLELAKPMLAGDDVAARDETRAVTAWVLQQLLALLNPVMPFVTEELYDALVGTESTLLTAPWPVVSDRLVDQAAKTEIDWLIRLIELVRSARSDMNVPVSAKPPLLLVGANDAARVRLDRYQPILQRLARISEATVAAAVPAGSIQLVLDEATVVLPIADLIDVAAERVRLEKEVSKLVAEIGKMDQKLGNASFVERAPEEVVDELRERRSDADAARSKLEDALKMLAAA
ncbi:valine--tRNA ligase [Roseiterribacter gracilis]|uniref:Valine--tRNA ligase n=1 Tax=Roseiterribacter gracilis TaxID=2812848 RepID=A0A8S8X902_9PROT|nr:valine--tRNA ligase [Rhodospirillales bacterium TMPK1]